LCPAWLAYQHKPLFTAVLLNKLLNGSVGSLQVDFLDRSAPVAEALRSFADTSKQFIAGVSGSANNRSESMRQATEDNKAADASKDGRLGFVRYEPSMMLVGGITYFSSVAAYAAYAGVPHA
jgi:hypothetical protein